MGASSAASLRVAILGTGLIGGSFGLALRKYGAACHIVGWDKEEALRRAEAAGAIHEGSTDLSRALDTASLVYVALPIGATLEWLPEIARHAAPHALVTDACSTKLAVCRAAARHFGGASDSGDRQVGFLGGHPMAGKEYSGVEHGDAELFRGKKYILIREAEPAGQTDSRAHDFAALVQAFGARPVWLDAETHDWAVAIISQLPQLVSV